MKATEVETMLRSMTLPTGCKLFEVQNRILFPVMREDGSGYVRGAHCFYVYKGGFKVGLHFNTSKHNKNHVRKLVRDACKELTA